MTGKEKIPILIAEKSQDLLKLLIPKIVEIATTIGIENLGQPDIKLPDTCLPASDIEQLLTLRNNIIDKLNSTSKIIENLSKPITPLNNVVNTTTTVLQTLNTAISVAKIAIPLLPTPSPGVPAPASAALVVLNTIQDLERKIFPKITLAKNSINSISEALDRVNSIIFSIINILNSIDNYLLKCKSPSSSTELTSLNNYLTTVVNDYTQAETTPVAGEIYQGFILEIVTVPFSPTVNKVKAVAKNSNGIILLQSPESFTTTPQVLIEELKLIIDKSNLKAN